MGKNLKQMRTLSPEWYAEAYRRLGNIYKTSLKLTFPINLLVWAVVVPLTTLMFILAIVKHKMAGC
jgi:hypothetical protein